MKQMTKKVVLMYSTEWSWPILVRSAVVHKKESTHAVRSSWIVIDALDLVLATGQYVRSSMVVDGHRKTRSLGQYQQQTWYNNNGR